MKSFRLLPLTMFMAFLLLGLKVGEVMRDGRLLLLSFAQANAESTENKDAAKPAEKEKTAEKSDKDKTDKKDDGAKKAEEAKPADAPVEGEDTEEAPQKHEFSQVEVDLLQSLAKRRQDLDDWAKQIQLKENMLTATEQRINSKIDSLEKVKKQVEDLLAQYNEQEDTKIRSLVKIYENMKPKDAARIFEELDMPVLLMVVDRMSERKVSPVLAAMSPTKAKDLTIQLAEQRKLQKMKNASATPAAAQPDASNPATPDASNPAAQDNPAVGAAAAPSTPPAASR
jgi:flagellar motility protein MotE (MotC chaperone)